MTKLLEDERVQMLLDLSDIKKDIKRIKQYATRDGDLRKLSEIEKKVHRIDKELKKHLH